MEDKMQWFVVNVHTGCEDKVARGLREQIDRMRFLVKFWSQRARLLKSRPANASNQKRSFSRVISLFK